MGTELAVWLYFFVVMPTLIAVAFVWLLKWALNG